MEKLPLDTQEWLKQTWKKMDKKLTAECARLGSLIPYTPVNGKYVDVARKDANGEGIYWWTNGFWPGILWQMYHATQNEIFQKAAVGVEERLDQALEGWEGLHHDVGFMWLHSGVAHYRLTGDAAGRRRGLHAANLLAGRYNPIGKFIRAWNGDKTGWIIIDCMMNIPLLYWASRELNDPRFRMIAEAHANTAMEKLLRPDGSTNHIAILDPMTGEVLETPAGQGYEAGSSWSRGQAWAVYGFALSYRHTNNPAFLDAAKRAAHYFLANAADSGYVPLVDFRSPAEPVKYDTTAGVCTACGLLEIAEHVSEFEKPLYVNGAVKILKATDARFCNWDPEYDSIVQSGCAAYHNEKEADVPIIYGDYFFTEAVLRLLGKDFLIW